MMEASMEASSVQELALPRSGEMLNGKYRLLRHIGQGGMGVVMEAVHLRLRKRVAIKFLHPRMLFDRDSVERFEREARNAARLTGLHAARIFDVDQTPAGVPFMVCELLRGKSLETELGQRGALPVAEAVDYVLQACAAMIEAHAIGLMHRDLKPSNLFLLDAEPARVLKVIDFGISKLATAEEPELTTTGMILGSPYYAAPEQLMDVRSVDSRADIWSLGVILYRALSGALPFERGTATEVVVAVVTRKPIALRQLRPDLPEALASIVERAMARSPDDRYPSVEELARALGPFGSGVMPSADALPAAPEDEELRVEDSGPPTEALSPSPVAADTPVRRSRGPWIAGGAFVAIALVMVLVFASRSRAKPEDDPIPEPTAVAPPVESAPALPTVTAAPVTTGTVRAAPSHRPARPKSTPHPAPAQASSKAVDPAFL
jgi:serine/threonine protein kinase